MNPPNSAPSRGPKPKFNKNAQGNAGYKHRPKNNNANTSQMTSGVSVEDLQKIINLVKDMNTEQKASIEKPQKNRQQTSNMVPHDTISCPICMEPMLGPIYQCTSGHSMCDSCFQRLAASPFCPSCRVNMRQPIRNRALEDVIEKMKLPCSNRDKGCVFTLTANSLRDHLDECFYRTMACPMGAALGRCFWQGEMKDLSAHFQSAHATESMVQVNKEIPLRHMNLNSDDRKVHLVTLGKINFLLQVKVDTQQKRTFWLVQIVGTKKYASNWMYEIIFFSKNEPKRKFTYSDGCSADGENAQVLFQNLQSAVVPIDVLRALNKGGNLHYKLIIKKSD